MHARAIWPARDVFSSWVWALQHVQHSRNRPYPPARCSLLCDDTARDRNAQRPIAWAGWREYDGWLRGALLDSLSDILVKLLTLQWCSALWRSGGALSTYLGGRRHISRALLQSGQRFCKSCNDELRLSVCVREWVTIAALAAAQNQSNNQSVLRNVQTPLSSPSLSTTNTSLIADYMTHTYFSPLCGPHGVFAKLKLCSSTRLLHGWVGDPDPHAGHANYSMEPGANAASSSIYRPVMCNCARWRIASLPFRWQSYTYSNAAACTCRPGTASRFEPRLLRVSPAQTNVLLDTSGPNRWRRVNP